MTILRDLYLMFKMDDFEDTFVYSVFLFLSAIVSLLVYLLLFSIIGFIGEPLFNFDIYLLNSIILFLYLISIMFFWVFFIPFIFIIKDFILPQKYNNAIERNFRAAQYELEKIIEESDKNENSNLEKFIVKKKLLDIYSVANYYTYGIKTL